MRDGVVTLNGVAARFLDRERDLRTGGGGLPPANEVQPRVAGLLRVGDAPELAAGAQLAGVANLTAHLGIAWARIENDGRLVLVRHDLQYLRLDREVVVTDEFCGRGCLDFRNRNDFLFLRGTSAGALLLHQLLKAFLVHGKTPFARHQLGEVEWKAVGVVKRKSEGAGEGRPRATRGSARRWRAGFGGPPNTSFN